MSSLSRLYTAARARANSLTLNPSFQSSYNPVSITLFEHPQHSRQQQQQQQHQRYTYTSWFLNKGSRVGLGVAVSLLAGFLGSQPCMVSCAPEEKKQDIVTDHTQREGISTPQGGPVSNHGTPSDDSVVSAISSNIAPFIAQLGFGGVLGYSAGFATRTVGRMGAVAVGLGFIGIQTLAYQGYIDVKWAKIEENVRAALDQNNDGKLDEKDVNILIQRIMSVLRYGLPSSAGFGAGFLYGIRG